MNACGHHHVGHIGILGVDKEGEEFYQISIGGNQGETRPGARASLGKVIGPSFSQDEVPDAIERLIRCYLEHRDSEAERFIDTVARIGIEPFKEHVYGNAHQGPAAREPTAGGCLSRAGRRRRDGFVPDSRPTASVIVPLARLARAARRPARRARAGRRAARRGRRSRRRSPRTSSTSPLVAVHFPKFSDGRGFSTARLLRERYGYEGELRAIGDVLPRPALFLARCGFDAFALRDDEDPEAALAAFGEFTEAYQATVERAAAALPRRRLAAAA